MKKILLTICLLFSLPPVTAQEVPLYENIQDNVPKLGVMNEVYLGDRMLEQRTGEYRECIIPKQSYSKQYATNNWRIKGLQPLCKDSAITEFYATTNYFIVEACEDERKKQEMIGCNHKQTQVRLVENKNSYELHICGKKFMGKGRTCFRNLTYKNIDKNDVKVESKYFLYQENSFQQTIEYAGKSGNLLKFVYSEFIQGLARDAFNREFQVDLTEGNVLAFKGAIIEIENASNINIRYKVIRNFRD